MKCRVCNRRLGPKHAAAGVGPVCAKRERAAADGVRYIITFLSSPRTTKTDRRSWLFRRKGEPSRLVRVFPDKKGRTATCDCEQGRANKRCEHVDAVAKADWKKFYEQTEN